MDKELAALGPLYVTVALDTFAESYGHLDLAAPLGIEHAFLATDALTAACSARNVADGERLFLMISEACLARLATDLDLNEDAETAYLEWRLFWVAFHEIAHWLYGHLPLYRDKGWFAHIGEQIGLGEAAGSPTPDPAATIEPLAHAAELQADAFATVELFKFIEGLEGPHDEGDTLTMDVAFCYYSIIPAIALFYVDGGDDGGGPLHPRWSVRCLNVLLTLFRLYADRRGFSGGPDITYENRVVGEVVHTFMTEAIIPVMEGIEAFAAEIGLPFAVHGTEADGLYDPTDFIRLLNGSFGEGTLAAELHAAFGNTRELNTLTAPLRSARNFVPADPVISDDEGATSFVFQVLSTLCEEELRALLPGWAAKTGAIDVRLKTMPYEGDIPARCVAELAFATAEPTHKRAAQAMVRALFPDIADDEP